MWSSARYKPHSELTKQSKTKRQSNFLQKTRAFDLKIQKLAAVLNESVASQKSIRKLHMKVFESIKESKWRTFCKSMWNQKALNHTNQLARILFVKVQKTQKLK